MFKHLRGEVVSLKGYQLKLGVIDTERCVIGAEVLGRKEFAWINLNEESVTIAKGETVEAFATNRFKADDVNPNTGSYRQTVKGHGALAMMDRWSVEAAPVVYCRVVAALLSHQVEGDEILKGLRAKDIILDVKLTPNYLGGWIITHKKETISTREFLTRLDDAIATRDKKAENS